MENQCVLFCFYTLSFFVFYYYCVLCTMSFQWKAQIAEVIIINQILAETQRPRVRILSSWLNSRLGIDGQFNLPLNVTQPTVIRNRQLR